MGEKARKNFVKRMIAGLVLGVICGIIASLAKTSINPDTWNVINMIFFQDITVSAGRSALGLFYIVQTLFTNALKLAIVPMVFFSIIMSVCSMNDMRKLGRIAGKTIVTFVLFYLVACVFAAIVSELVIGMGGSRPFQVDQAAANVTEIETSNILVTIVNAVPDNLISPMTSNNRMLAVITCAVVIGVCIASMGSQITVFKTFCGEAAQITQKFLDFLIITCSPISVFCMVTRTFAIYGIDQVSNIFSYILVTLITLIIYLLVAYPTAIGAITRCNPYIFMKKMIKVAIIAFGAAASAPALPLNKETCVKELGCSEEITNFVLPVGMTINMNGTAIMHIIGAAFIATCAGLEVTPMHYATMTLLAICASMGTPAIPAAGTVMLYAVLTGAGFGTELCTLIYSLILAMNKPCEMVLTTLNVVGDAATTVIVAKTENEFDAKVYNS